jgi:hypothetical protein
MLSRKGVSDTTWWEIGNRIDSSCWPARGVRDATWWEIGNNETHHVVSLGGVSRDNHPDPYSGAVGKINWKFINVILKGNYMVWSKKIISKPH